MDMSFSKLRDVVMDREAWSAAVHGVTKSWTWLSDLIELNWKCVIYQYIQRDTFSNKREWNIKKKKKKRIHLQCRRPRFHFWVRKFSWRKDRLSTLVFLGFPDDSAGKESAWNVGDLGSIPGLGWSPREGNSYSLQYSGLENSMDCTVHGITKSVDPWSDGC